MTIRVCHALIQTLCTVTTVSTIWVGTVKRSVCNSVILKTEGVKTNLKSLVDWLLDPHKK